MDINANAGKSFCPLLHKIASIPVLVHKPGHMFVGYYRNVAHTQTKYL